MSHDQLLLHGRETAFQNQGNYRALPSHLNPTTHKNSCKQRATLQYQERCNLQDTSAWHVKDKGNLLLARASWTY